MSISIPAVTIQCVDSVILYAVDRYGALAQYRFAAIQNGMSHVIGIVNVPPYGLHKFILTISPSIAKKNSPDQPGGTHEPRNHLLRLRNTSR